jgi:hypothetical protein
MRNKQILFPVLTVVSVCIAQSVNISGVVTNTAGTAIPGASVKLETGGQTATTDTEGQFLLTGGPVIIGSRDNQALTHRPTIHNGILNIHMAEKSAVAVTTFSLQGKELSTAQHLIDAGTHSIALPQREAGVYLYRHHEVGSLNRILYRLRQNSRRPHKDT